MRKVDHLILGAGISGLSLLWQLKKKSDNLLLLEKKNRVGGHISSLMQNDFLFELGPRSFLARDNGRFTLKLIEELGLESSVIEASRSAFTRYLLLEGSLKEIPTQLFQFLCSSLSKGCRFYLLTEYFRSKGTKEDESVYEFFSRRIGKKATSIFVDAFVTGVFAGDKQQLSMKHGFPNIFSMERNFGSLTKAFLRKKKELEPTSDFIDSFSSSAILSFKEGMETLPKRLHTLMQEHIELEKDVQKIDLLQDGVLVHLKNGEEIFAKHCYSALPAFEICRLLEQSLPVDIPFASIATVHLGYKNLSFPHKGFGYLVPSNQKQDVLGMVFDHAVFPVQQNNVNDCRLTVMIGDRSLIHFTEASTSDFLKIALDATSKHLNIKVEPDQVYVHLVKDAIAQYPVGHSKNCQFISNISPHLTLLGNSFYGIGVNDCVAHSLHKMDGLVTFT